MNADSGAVLVVMMHLCSLVSNYNEIVPVLFAPIFDIVSGPPSLMTVLDDPCIDVNFQTLILDRVYKAVTGLVDFLVNQFGFARYIKHFTIPDLN
jgi:hypothetical protein